MANRDSILKSRDITLLAKVHLVKAMVFPVVMYGCESWTVKKAECRELMLLNCGVGEDFWESLGLQGDPTSPSWRRSVLGAHWKDWCWSWNSSTLATWFEELIHWKRPWCWEGLGAGGERDGRGWDGWIASLTRWTWVWVNSGSWWWTGRPGMLQFMGSQRVGHDWATELNWKILGVYFLAPLPSPHPWVSVSSVEIASSHMELANDLPLYSHILNLKGKELLNESLREQAPFYCVSIMNEKQNQ